MKNGDMEILFVYFKEKQFDLAPCLKATLFLNYHLDLSPNISLTLKSINQMCNGTLIQFFYYAFLVSLVIESSHVQTPAVLLFQSTMYIYL